MTKRHTPGCWLAIVGLALIALALLCNSCRGPKVVTDTRYVHDTTFVEKVRVDSLVVKDSTFIREKGDTLFIYKEHYRDRYRYLRDTIRVTHTDSVCVVREVQVEKPLTRWQETRQRAFVPLVLALLLMVCLLRLKIDK